MLKKCSEFIFIQCPIINSNNYFFWQIACNFYEKDKYKLKYQYQGLFIDKYIPRDIIGYALLLHFLHLGDNAHNSDLIGL